MLSAFLTSLRTLTIIPIPGRDTSDFSSSLPFFPLVGAVIALFLYAAGIFFLYLFPAVPFLDGVAILAVSSIITGAIHLDGLGDAVDGFGGGKTKERILEIFKDSRMGTFGVVALIFDCLLKIILYSYFVQYRMWGIIIISAILSRTAQCIVLACMPYARSSGTALVFTSPRSPIPAIVSAIFALAVCIGIAGWKISLFALILPVPAVLLFVWYCYRKIDGVTGDCIGVVNELTEVGVLLSGALILRFL